MPESTDTPNDRFVQPRSDTTDFDMQIIEHRGERVLTLQMIDKVHQRPEGTARKRLNDNRSRFVEGRHIAKLSASVFRTRFPGTISDRATEDVTLITERGYLLLAKSFTDDLAWEVQERLIEGYFKAAQPLATPLIPQSLPEALRLAADLADDLAVERARTAELAPKAVALDRLETSEGSVGPRLAAKMLDIPERKFTAWLQSHHWAFRQNGIGPLQAYVEKRDRGYLEHRPHTYRDQITGEDKTIAQMLITPKGLARLAMLLGVDLKKAA